MVVHHLLKKTKGSNVTPPPSVVNVSTTVTSSGTDKSSVSDITNTNVPEIKRIHAPRRMAQIQRAYNLQKKKEINSAFKRATTMYDCERQKEDGMSAQAVVECIENDTGARGETIDPYNPKKSTRWRHWNITIATRTKGEYSRSSIS